jgi:hypothetical protein
LTPTKSIVEKGTSIVTPSPAFGGSTKNSPAFLRLVSRLVSSYLTNKESANEPDEKLKNSNADWKVVIRTSMNLNANKTCESFEIDEDQEVFDFYMKFITHTFDSIGPGFESSSFKVNKSLDTFFSRNSEKIKGWSEL